MKMDRKNAYSGIMQYSAKEMLGWLMMGAVRECEKKRKCTGKSFYSLSKKGRRVVERYTSNEGWGFELLLHYDWVKRGRLLLHGPGLLDSNGGTVTRGCISCPCCLLPVAAGTG